VLGMGGQEMEQIPSTSQFSYYKQFVVDTKDVVQANDVVVSPQFSQDIDFFLKLGNVLGVVAQHDTLAGKLFPLARSIRSVSLGFTATGDTDLSVGTLANDQVSVQEISGSTRGCGGIGYHVGLFGRVVGYGRGWKGGLQ